MFIWTLQAIIISVIFIFLVHNLFGFFKNTLTVPKIKDLVNLPSQNYENMFNVLQKNKPSKSVTFGQDIVHNYDLLPTTSGSSSTTSLETLDNPYALNNSDPSLTNSAIMPTSAMKNELKNFFKKKMDSSSHNQTQMPSVSSLDSASYSTF